VRAATDVTANLVVAAGAGTGKTSLLVERFLNLILSETVPLSAVAAITFTEKAAAELNRRVEDALDAILHATGPRPEAVPMEHEARRSLTWLEETLGMSRDAIHRRARDRMDRLEDAFTGTIHAFCSDLLRRHPMAAGIPPEFSVDDGASQAFAFETLWTEFLAGEWGASGERARLWSSVLAAFSEKEIEDAARSLVTTAEARDVLDRRGYVAQDVRTVLAPRIRALTGDLGRIQSGIHKDIRIRKTIETAQELLGVFGETGPSGLREADPAHLSDPGFWEKRAGTVGAGYPAGEKEGAESRVREAQDLLKGLRRIHEPAIADLLEMLRPFARQFREHIGREGLLSFDDLLLLARDLLSDNEAIRLAESQRFRQILVDEFQDTDPLQYEIVFLLASEETGSVRDPFATPLSPGKLFIVGDPKQSIYRFRGADISAYLRARDHVLDGGQPASLVTNFRSRPGILDVLNPLFAGWMGPRSPDEADVEPVYEPIHAHRPAAASPGVSILSVETADKAKVEVRRRAEAGEIARRIREWVDSGTYGPSDIAVLFRSLMDSPIYTRALREAGIDFVVDGGRAFFERPEVGEAFCLLRALANPADHVATVGVLRSPVGGVPDAELVAFVRAGGNMRWKRSREPALSGFPRIRRAFERLREWDDLHTGLPVDRWILRVLTESAFTLLTAAFFDGPQRVANVRKLAEKTATLVRERGVTLEQAVQVLEDEFAGERVEGESPLADEAVRAVRILTMHKAKGLEFPAVIIPDLGRQPPNELPETRVRTHRTEAGVFLAVDVAHRSWLSNGAAVVLSEDKKRHERAESKRLFYVATTRAREELVFVNSDPGNRDWLKAMSAAWGYRFPDATTPDEETLLDGRILHRRVRPGPRPALPSPKTGVDVIPGVRSLEAAAAAARDAAAVRFRSPSGDARAQDLESVAGAGAPAGGRDVARACGVAVHRLLETWDFRDAGALRAAAGAAAAAAAAAAGADPQAVRADVRAVVDGLLASSLPRRLAGAVILGREVPILYRDAADTTVFGYADLLYRWDGTFHVADYKTDAEATREQAERYRSQLTDYGEAVKRAWNLPEFPVLEILFVRTGERIPVPPSPAS
jgi:ATP-dependent helicase/nuclease subunit A